MMDGAGLIHRATEPAFESPAADLVSAEQHRAMRLVRLYDLFQRAPETPLSDTMLNRLLERIDGWEYAAEPDELGQPVHYLTRQVLDASLQFKLPDKSTPIRSVHRDKESITLRIAGDAIRGKDVLKLLRVESQYPYEMTQMTAPDRSAMELIERAKAEFANTGKAYLNEGDWLTDTQIVVLRYMTHFPSNSHLAEAFGITANTLQTVLKPLYDHYNISPTPGQPHQYVELMLHAIALGIASIDHIDPVRDSELNSLTPSEKDVYINYYSGNTEERQRVRKAKTSTAHNMIWGKIYKKVHTSGNGARHQAVLKAVKKGVLRLPDVTTELKQAA